MTPKPDGEAPRLAHLDYLVTSVLGTRSHSTVLLVTNRKGVGGRYALKVIKREGPEADLPIERARAECEASSKLGHPAILKVYDFRLCRSWFRVHRAEQLMEYIDGKPLDAWDSLPLGAAILAFQRTAAALAHMHRRGVIHGDIQPRKILVARTGRVVVRGYGLSQVRDDLKAQVKPPADFVAPEREREHGINERADIYSLGATMYRIATGRPAAGLFGRSEGKKLPTPVALNPEIPPLLNTLIISCLQTAPDRRPPDMYEIAERLDELVKGWNLSEANLQALAAEEV